MSNPYLLKFAGAMEKQGSSLDQMLGQAFLMPSDTLAPTQNSLTQQQVSPNGGGTQGGQAGYDDMVSGGMDASAPLDAGGIPDVNVPQAPSMGPQQGAQPGQYGRLTPYAETYAMIERQKGLPEGTLMHLAGLESSYGKNLKNPRSSATGPFQIIDSTREGLGMSYEDVMDPVRSAEGAADLAVEAMPMLRNTLGREPTKGEIYLAHQQGAGGAQALLKNPQMNVVDALSTVMSREKALAHVRLNGGNTSMSAGEFSSMWTNKLPSGASPSSYNTEADNEIYGDISPRRGDRDPSRVDELSQNQISDIEQEIEDEELSPEDKQKQYRGMLLMAIGKGLSQMSSGQDVDIMSVVQSYHERQDAYKRRIADLKKQQRAVYQRAQDRQWTVEDQEDAQAHAIRLQEMERRADIERQTAQNAWQSAENLLGRNLERELQEGKITSQEYMQLRDQQHAFAMQLDDQGFREQFAKNRDAETARQNEQARRFTGQQNMFDRIHQSSMQQTGIAATATENEKERTFQAGQQTERLGVSQYESQADRDLQEKMQAAGFEFQAGESAADRALRISLQADQIASTEGMQDKDIQAAKDAAAAANEFAHNERLDSQTFTLTRDSADYDFRKLMQDNEFTQQFAVLKDTQKYEAKQAGLRRAFEQGMARERMDFDQMSAEEMRAYEMGRDGRQNEFNRGLEELRSQHIAARDKDLAGYAKDVVDDQRRYDRQLKTEVGKSLADAMEPMLEGFSDSEREAIRASIIASPEGGYENAVNLQKMQQDRKDKELELNNRKELAALLEKQEASPVVQRLALEGNTEEAMKQFKVEHPDDQFEFERFALMNEQDKYDYLRWKSSGANIDPALAAKIQINMGAYEEANTRYAEYKKVGDQAKQMLDIMNNNPSMTQGIFAQKTLGFRKFLADIGLGDTKDLDDQQLFQAMAANAARLAHVAGTGAQSDKDIALNLQGQAGLDKTPGANRVLLQLHIGNQERAAVEKKAIEDFLGMGGGTAEERDKFIATKMADAGLNKPIIPVLDGGLSSFAANRANLDTGKAFAVRENGKTEYYFMANNPNGKPIVYDNTGTKVDADKLGLKY